MKRLLFSGILLCLTAVAAIAQSGTNSPYSQFGLGVLSDQSQGANRGMNGLGIGLRAGTMVNTLNPASYSAIDSLTMIFDLGMMGQITNFKEGGVKKNAKNANFEYAVALFRVMPRMGVSVGVLPITNIGYNYTSESTFDDPSDITGNTRLTGTTSYLGDGGLREAFVGVGYELVKGLSIGANIGYMWGSYSKIATMSYSDENAKSYTKTYEATIKSYKLDLGIQYQHLLGKKDLLTVGGIFGLGHRLNGNPSVMTLVTEVVSDSITNAFQLPMSFGLGVSWCHNRSLTIGADYQYQGWGKLDFPEVDPSTNKYHLSKGLLRDRHKVTLGADWIPDPVYNRNFFKRIHYRAGVSYATPYNNIGGQKGPKELSATIGFGIPLVNAWNNRSVLNVSFQWSHQSAKDLITENTFRINLGLTFNERWFAKWRVD